MSLSLDEMRKRVECIHNVERMIYPLETCKPITCYKTTGDSFIDYGVIDETSLIKFTEHYSHINWIKITREQRSNVKAIVVHENSIILFFLEGGPVLIPDPVFVQAVSDLLLQI